MTEYETMISHYPLASVEFVINGLSSVPLTVNFELAGRIEYIITSDPTSLLLHFPEWPNEISARAAEHNIGLYQNRVQPYTTMTFTVRSIAHHSRTIQLSFLGTTLQSSIVAFKQLRATRRLADADNSSFQGGMFRNPPSPYTDEE